MPTGVMLVHRNAGMRLVMATKLPVINDKRELFSSQLFKIEALDLTFSNGNTRTYERIAPQSDEHTAVLIVPMLDNDTILLIKEYSSGVEDYTLGFPKGAIDQGEDLYQAADRELMEEAGFSAKHYSYLKDVYLSPNYMRQHISLVIAEDLTVKTAEGDEPENLEVVPWKLADIDALITHPQFIECRSFAALLFVWKKWLGK